MGHKVSKHTQKMELKAKKKHVKHLSAKNSEDLGKRMSLD